MARCRCARASGSVPPQGPVEPPLHCMISKKRSVCLLLTGRFFLDKQHAWHIIVIDIYCRMHIRGKKWIIKRTSRLIPGMLPPGGF